MKTCVTCKLEKPLDEFNKLARAKDGKQPRCRDCHKLTYQGNKKEHIARVNARSKAVRKKLLEYVWELKRKPCMDCGQTFHPVVMDYDHVRGSKSCGIAGLITKEASLERIQEEIDKCDLVCANCHRVRTFTRSGVIIE